MKTIQSIDDITKASDIVSLPSIDVRQNVMQKIYRRKENKRMIRGKRLAIAIIAGVFMVLTVGFTVVKVWELNGPDGKQFNFSLFNNNDIGTISEQQEKLIPKWEDLKPGEVLAVLKTKNNPQNMIGITPKPLVVTDLNQLKEKVGSGYVAPESIPEKYTFKEGQINGGLPDSIQEEMLEEAKTTTSEAIFRVIEPSDYVFSYSIIYQDEEKKNNFDIYLQFDFKSNSFGQQDNGQSVTKLKVRDFEALYIDGNGRSDIKWVDSSKHILYSVGCPEGNITKDELLKIAESLK